jgi:hypothetical protein
MTHQGCQELAETCAPSRQVEIASRGQLLMGFCHLTLQQVDTDNSRQEDRSEFIWPLIARPLPCRLLQKFRFPSSHSIRVSGAVLMQALSTQTEIV